VTQEDRDTLDRIERKLDLLIAALAEEEEQADLSLDGIVLSRERDDSQPL
jgi:hypothetical protein